MKNKRRFVEDDVIAEKSLKKDILKYLKQKRIDVSLPVTIRFKMFKGTKIKSFHAKRGEWVVRWKDILKSLRGLK